MLPKIQIALDNVSFADALRSLSDGVADEIDIIEAGTILICAEGKKVIDYLRMTYPKKTIVADVKMADAAQVLTPMMLDAGADFMTIICCADLATMEASYSEASKRNKQLQIELYGAWNFEQAESWKKTGIEHVIYHRSRDSQLAGAEWSPSDITKLERLCDMGFKVTVTGGLMVKDISLFAHIPVYAFIAGRSIRDSKTPAQEVKRYKAEIQKYYVRQRVK